MVGERLRVIPLRWRDRWKALELLLSLIVHLQSKGRVVEMSGAYRIQSALNIFLDFGAEAKGFIFWGMDVVMIIDPIKLVQLGMQLGVHDGWQQKLERWYR